MAIQNEEPKTKVAIGIAIGFTFLVILCMISAVNYSGKSGGNSESSPSLQTQQKSNDSFWGKMENVLQSQEKRFGCEDGKIENLTGVDLTKTKTTFKIMDNIRTNRVEYPLNKDEVMMEYCFRVANLTSDMGDLELKVELLDKDKNVLSRDSKIVWDIPGKRIKTVYGYQMVNVGLANEITSILVGK